MTNVSERIKTVITRSKNPTLKVGDKPELIPGACVRNKDSGELGVIRKSRFGVKVAGRNAEGERWKTNGYAPEYVARYWEVVDDD